MAASKIAKRSAAKVVGRRGTSSSSSTCGSPIAGAPRWVIYACIAVIAVVILVLVYQWAIARKAMERFTEKKVKYNMIFIHMDGCGHCVRFAPVWSKFQAEEGQNLLESHGIELLSMERADWEAWREKNGAVDVNVNGFPTVLMLDAQTHVEVGRFAAERTAENLRAWAVSTAAAAKS
jgi:Thioredoxin